MANMIPAQPKEFDPRSHEGDVFYAFQKLSDDYYVFHSFAPAVVTDDKTFYEREMDFVIANQKKGVLAIEVKAGHNIHYTNRTWYYGNGELVNDGKGPYNQVADAKYTIKNKIKFHSNEKIRELHKKVRFFHGVFFPDMLKSQFADLCGLAEDADPEITLFAEDLVNPGKRISEIFSISLPIERHTSFEPLSDEEFDLLLDGVLCPEFHLVESPVAKTILLGERMNQLTREQYKVLDFLDEDQKTAVINGAAGTGKTMLAIEKARRHSIAGDKVLFLCYNRLLCQQLANAYSGRDKKQYKNIDFMTIDKLTMKITGDNKNYSGLGNWLLNCIDEPQLFEYKHIIIDEGQDFGLVDKEAEINSEDGYSSIIDLLQEVSLNAGGTFYLFYDKNQMIQGSDEIRYSLPDCIVNSDCRLTLHTNCRNTREIARTSYTPLKDKKKRSIKPGPTLSISGMSVVPVMHISNNLLKSLNQILDDLNRNKIDDIVILTPGTIDYSGISSELSSLVDDYWYYPYKGEKYRVTTCKRFKGLEADSIIMIDLNKKSFRNAKGLEFYVGTSRAKFRLDFICSISDQDYKEIIRDLDPDAPIPRNLESLRDVLGNIFQANVEVD